MDLKIPLCWLTIVKVLFVGCVEGFLALTKSPEAVVSQPTWPATVDKDVGGLELTMVANAWVVQVDHSLHDNGTLFYE